MNVTYQGAYFVPSSAPPATLLLDSFPGSNLAFSTARKLRAAYAGNCMRIRRSTDNAELDIGFVSNEVDEAAITAFNPGGDCFIYKLYCQDGSGNFLFAGPADQPQVMATGTLIKVNGKLAGQNGFLAINVPISAAGPDWSFFQVSKRAASGLVDWFLYGANYNSLYTSFHFTNDLFYMRDQLGFITSNATNATANQNLLTSIRTLAGQSQYLNGALIPSTNTVALTVSATFDSFGSSAAPFNPTGYFQEGVFYPVDQTGANQAGIEANQRVYYGF